MHIWHSSRFSVGDCDTKGMQMWGKWLATSSMFHAPVLYMYKGMCIIDHNCYGYSWQSEPKNAGPLQLFGASDIIGSLPQSKAAWKIVRYISISFVHNRWIAVKEHGMANRLEVVNNIE